MDLIELAAREIETVDTRCTLLEAARRMADESVGCLVITEPGSAVPLGIVTDRDLVMLLARGADPSRDTVASLTTRALETLRVGEDLQQATHKMRKHGVRRLPIVDAEGRLSGIVALDDLLVLLGRGMADLALAVEGELLQERSGKEQAGG
jgi:CBS domain-containing protein